MTIADVSNNNLLGPQSELIQWRSKHCINMNHVNELMLTLMLMLLLSMVTRTTMTPCVYAVARAMSSQLPDVPSIGRPNF
jgi:hypothetical protein